MIIHIIFIALLVLLTTIYFIMKSEDDERIKRLEKEINEYELIGLIFNDLKKSNDDCYITDMRIINDVLCVEYWYYGEDSEEKRLEKVKKIVKENCDFHGSLLGIDIRDVKITINKLDFINETI